MLLIPIMKTISMHALCVLVRQHDQNLDDEPIVFNFNGPDDDVLGDAGDSKDYLDSGNSDPFTGCQFLCHPSIRNCNSWNMSTMHKVWSLRSLIYESRGTLPLVLR